MVIEEGVEVIKRAGERLGHGGECLPAGETVLAGSFTRPALAKKGDVFNADYGPLGRFDFTFT